MKFISYEVKDELPQVTVETGRWLFKKQITYQAISHIVSRYYRWVDADTFEIVHDSLSFQLDTWKETAELGL